MAILTPAPPRYIRMCLTWRARPNEVESFKGKRERIGLVKLEGISGLRVDIDTGNVKARAVKSDGRSSSSTEKIQGLWALQFGLWLIFYHADSSIRCLLAWHL